MDKMVRDRLWPNTMRQDRVLARIQALYLDAVGPLASLVDQAETGTLTVDQAVTAAKLAFWFVGNATVHTSREW